MKLEAVNDLSMSTVNQWYVLSKPPKAAPVLPLSGKVLGFR